MTEAARGEAKQVESIDDLLTSFAKSAARVYLPEFDKHGNPCLARFLFDNGRLPFISDEIKPWRYRGWLVPYAQMAEANPAVAPRYDYVLRTIDAGRLLDEPIPQIDFCGEFEPSVKPGIRMLQKCLDKVEYSMGVWNGMRELAEWIGFALGVTTQPSRLDEKAQEFLYRNFNLEPLLLAPADYLGQMLSESNYGKRNGFYPTPTCVVKMMTECVFFDRRAENPSVDHRTDKVCDPCVGTGRMLLVASNYSLRLYGQDIDYLCCLICKINLALYAPWFYIPDSFFADADEKPDAIVKASRTENEARDAETRKSDANLQQPETLFDRLRRQKREIKRAQKKRKVYTTDIEQPTLFGKE